MPGTSPVAIVTAVEPEAKAIRNKLATMNTDRDRCVTVHVTGMGPQRAEAGIRQLICEQRPERVIIAGFCGGLAPDIQLGQLVIPARLIEHRSGDHCSATWQHTIIQNDRTLITTDQPVHQINDKQALYQSTGADIVDMESYTVAQCCNTHHLPWLCLRAVTDRADQIMPEAFDQLVDPTGRPRIGKAIGLIATRPWLIGELLSLAQRSALAAQQLADAIAQLVCQPINP